MKQRQAGFLIAKIHQLSGRIFTKILKKNKIDEINPSQGRILFVLWENDNISIHELAKKTSLGKSTLTSMLDRLEKSGYLIRKASERDRREIIIQRTEKDKNLQKLYTKVSKDMNDLFYEGFTNKEIDHFEKYLSRIYENLSLYEIKIMKG